MLNLPCPQAALSRAASTMIRGRSSNLDGARVERSGSVSAPGMHELAPASPYGEAAPVTLMSAVEGPDGRIIIDSVQMGSPAGAADTARNVHGRLAATPGVALHNEASVVADASVMRPQPQHAERSREIRIEMVSPPQSMQPSALRVVTWVSPFANATFWPAGGSGSNTPQGGPSRAASGNTALRGDEAV